MTRWVLEELTEDQRDDLDDLIYELKYEDRKEIQNILTAEGTTGGKGVYNVAKDDELRAKAVIAKFRGMELMKPVRRKRGKGYYSWEDAGNIAEHVLEQMKKPVIDDPKIARLQH
jgi:hypothetical protein